MFILTINSKKTFYSMLCLIKRKRFQIELSQFFKFQTLDSRHIRKILRKSLFINKTYKLQMMQRQKITLIHEYGTFYKLKIHIFMETKYQKTHSLCWLQFNRIYVFLDIYSIQFKIWIISVQFDALLSNNFDFGSECFDLWIFEAHTTW